MKRITERWKQAAFGSVLIFQLALLSIVVIKEYGYAWSKREWLFTALLNITLNVILSIWAYKSATAPSDKWFRRTIFTSGLVLAMLAYDCMIIPALSAPSLDVPILIVQSLFGGIVIAPLVGLLYLTTVVVEIYQKRRAAHAEQRSA